MISAAMSMSRVAIHMRPSRPRIRFLAASASTTTIASTNRYFCIGVWIGKPNRSRLATATEPDGA